MTTFTTEDRINASPPHVVDSGASVMGLDKERSLAGEITEGLKALESMRNNEPVAWAREDGVIAFHKKPEVDSQGFKWFPLYTHPIKELADEEIMALWKPMPDTKVYVRDLYAFARAILRKAQEK